MYDLHISIHGRGEDVTDGEAVELRGEKLSTLDVPVTEMSHPLPVTFEQAVEALEQLGRPFVEPDGSFVWSSSAAEDESWLLDGVLYDRGGRLNHVDLKGTCPAERFDQLLAVLGWPAVELMFQLSREAVYLDEATFRRWALARS